MMSPFEFALFMTMAIAIPHGSLQVRRQSVHNLLRHGCRTWRFLGLPIDRFSWRSKCCVWETVCATKESKQSRSNWFVKTSFRAPRQRRGRRGRRERGLVGLKGLRKKVHGRWDHSRRPKLRSNTHSCYYCRVNKGHGFSISQTNSMLEKNSLSSG